VVLHDTVLYFLAAGGGRGALLKQLCLDRGRWALREWRHIVTHSPNGNMLDYPHPEDFPMLTEVLRQASELIVHSRFAKQLVAEAGYRGPVHVVHHPGNPAEFDVSVADVRETRVELGIPQDAIVFGAFGFVAGAKRLHRVLRALEEVLATPRFRLLIVGAGDDLRSIVDRSRIRDCVIRRGFVNDSDFLRYIAAVDVVVNLRHPSMGEASGPLIQAMACGRPCIVTDHAWFSELPDDCVWKIPYDSSEVEALAKAITTLEADAYLRKRLGEAAKSYVTGHCLPDQVANEYMKIFGERSSSGMEAIDERVEPVEKGASKEPDFATGESDGSDNDTTPEWVRTYFDRRIKRALP
jgi:glycosyltransferase involved in cell wall biosynthesis